MDESQPVALVPESGITVETAEEGRKRQRRHLQDVEAVRDLFARAHDYIAQAQYPGHAGMKVAEVLNFLAFQHNDFKNRAETLKKQMDSSIDAEEVKAVVDETLTTETLKFHP